MTMRSIRSLVSFSIKYLAIALFAFSSFVPTAHSEGNSLFVYPYPPQVQYTHHNDDFTVQVRIPGDEWEDLYEWNVRVDHDNPQDASMVYFDFTGQVEVRIQKNNGSYSNVSVGPHNNAPVPTIKDDKVHFTLDRPANLAVFFDEDRLHNLHIFAGTPPTEPKGENVRVFEPGLHRPSDGGAFFNVESGERIYLKGGTVLMGTFKMNGVQGVKISGRGLILPPPENNGSQFRIDNSQNISIEGLIIAQADAGAGRVVMSKDVKISDIKGISGGRWTDGINIFSSERINLDRLFLRTSDDCLTVYTHRNKWYGDARDIKVTNSTLWADVAHAMFIGVHGNSIDPEVIERVTFDNIDVVSIDEDDPEYEGVMAITAGDSNTVRNITFSNIRVDRIEEGKLFNIRVDFNSKYNTSPGMSIENVLFQNISYSGKGMPSASVIVGYDETRKVKGISFENVTIDGEKLEATHKEAIHIGDFVEDVHFQ